MSRDSFANTLGCAKNLSKLRTNWNRHILLGLPSRDSTVKRLRPPEGYHIKGFYIRFRLRAFGVVYATGSRGSRNASCLPILETPAMPQDFGMSQLHFFASSARLFRIHKIWIYYDAEYCTGLRLFYDCKSSEALGRTIGDQFQEFALHSGDTIRRVRVTFTTPKHKIKRIEFETDPQESPGGTAELFNATESTVCVKSLYHAKTTKKIPGNYLVVQRKSGCHPLL